MDEQRAHAKQVAAFNLEVSEAVKEEKAHCPPYHTSFIFLDRPFTPARKIQQHRYMDELQAQVGNRKQYDAQDQQNRLLLEHLDRVQLVQEINLQKAQQFQQKQERTKHYKMALDTQVEAGHRSKADRRVRLPPIQEKISQSRDTVQVEDRKGTGLPQHQPSSSGFGRCETPAINAEGRERAQKVFQEQLITATQKKRNELYKRQAQQKKESEMLTRNRRDLILDRISRFEKKRNMRASLEDTWSRSAGLKHQREDEERRFLRSGGQLLIDQCEQYRRCYQCERKTFNQGESNIWKDSHYVSGSRLMI
ncbi:coiled-coil domain-containing protein 81-like [Centroberyx affinis]|uniref:coiled-coil domain-containing protein 81-like n=1 Tax=Centroberyx affinis TaxID=166261 RepID=UPI003A5BD0C4